MNWFNFLLYMITMAFTPGPNNLASMANMAKVGFKKGIIFNIGIFASQVILMTLCMVLCTTISNILPAIKLPLQILGSIYILYLAYKTYRSPGPGDEKAAEGTFASGFVLNTLNVKYILFCIVTLQTYIIPGNDGSWTGILIMGYTAVLVALTAHVSWGLFGVAIRNFYKSHVKAVNIVLSLLLLYCAVIVFF